MNEMLVDKAISRREQVGCALGSLFLVGALIAFCILLTYTGG